MRQRRPGEEGLRVRGQVAVIPLARALIFYGLIMGGGLLMVSGHAVGLLVFGAGYAWGYFFVCHSDHDVLSSVIFFVFVASFLVMFAAAVVETVT